MDLIKRDMYVQVKGDTPPKAAVIYGARQIGKTTLMRELTKDSKAVTWVNGDATGDVERLQLKSSKDLEVFLRQGDVLVIDEAQRIPDIGLIVKRLVDVNVSENVGTQIYVSGSSSLLLAKGVRESAVGRIVQRQMWPLSIDEIARSRSWAEVNQNLDRMMVYGLFPEPYMDPDKAAQRLRDYCDGVLYRDLHEFAEIRSVDRFDRLVKFLAYNIGSEVNYESLARETGLSPRTVADYIKALEECYMVKVCPSFSRNLSNELKKGKKVYFCDNGLRNAVIGDFSPMSARRNNDAGALWENFFFMERVKLHCALNDMTQLYFWRTTGSTPYELDFIEVNDEGIKAFECKMNPKAKAKPGKFLQAYPEASLQVISPRDLMKLWLMPDAVNN